jgi:transcriptional regulator GlxA family with amidase domain
MRRSKLSAAVAESSCFEHRLPTATCKAGAVLEDAPMVDVTVIILPGVLDAALALVLDVLAAANRARRALGKSALFEVHLQRSEKKRVRSGLGFPVTTERAISVRGRVPAVLIVPGANQLDAASLVADARAPRYAELRRVLLRCAQQGAIVSASCSAVFHLAGAGLLDGRTATTSWFLAAPFRAAFPRTTVRPESTLVRDREIWTAGAALSITDLALAIVQHFCGTAVERTVARYLVLDGHPTQARYSIAAHLASAAPELAQAEAWVRANIGQSFSIPNSRRLRADPRALRSADSRRARSPSRRDDPAFDGRDRATRRLPGSINPSKDPPARPQADDA